MAKKKKALKEIRTLKADIDKTREKSEKIKKTQEKHPVVGTALKILSIGKIALAVEKVLHLVLPVVFAIVVVIVSLIKPKES